MLSNVDMTVIKENFIKLMAGFQQMNLAGCSEINKQRIYKDGGIVSNCLFAQMNDHR